MAKGDREKLIQPFLRVERFLTKIAGKKIFEFEDIEEPAKAQIKKQATVVNKPVERQKSILKNQSSIKIPPNTGNNIGSPLQSQIKKVTQQYIITNVFNSGSVVLDYSTE